jgi:MFS family permease
MVGLWVVVAVLCGLGVGAGDAGSLGVLLESIGLDRIVLAMVVWSQVFAVGYLVGPAIGGGVAQVLGYGALGLVPLVASAFVFVGFARVRSEPAAA